jgi:hypothetical protein
MGDRGELAETLDGVLVALADDLDAHHDVDQHDEQQQSGDRETHVASPSHIASDRAGTVTD